MWAQYELQIPAMPRGFHLITRSVVESATGLPRIQSGLLHVFLRHTSASLSINENADPDVPLDLELGMNHVAPEDLAYRHTCEGPDDMPAHTKSSLLGCSLTIPVSRGRLALGTWQGIYLCEHRDHATRRQILLTLHGEPFEE